MSLGLGALYSFIIALCWNAHAFEDPAGLMTKLDQAVAGVDFSQAFHKGDQFTLRRLSCSAGGTGCGTTGARYEVMSGDGQKAEVATYIGARPDPSRIAKVTRAQWEGVSGNMARNEVSVVESYGVRVMLTDLRETTVTLSVNGVTKTVAAFELSFASRSATGATTSERLTLAKECGGPGQILRKITDNAFSGQDTTELLSCTLME